jgi:hypothetical protein
MFLSTKGNIFPKGITYEDQEIVIHFQLATKLSDFFPPEEPVTRNPLPRNKNANLEPCRSATIT